MEQVMLMSTIKLCGTETGRFTSSTNNITEQSKQQTEIDRQRKNKRIMRANKAQFVGFSIS